MNDLETELRDLMRDRAAALTSVPPVSLLREEPPARAGRGRRRAVTLALAATLVLGAGIAIAQVVGSHSVTPTSDRYLIASGEEGDGSWELTLYQAEIEDRNGETATGWCLDLDAPSVNDPGASTTTRANICTMDGEPSWSGPVGAMAVYPGFADGQSLIYGQVSEEVARVDVSIGGEAQQVTLVPAPEGTPAGVSYFAALAPGSGDVELVALDQNGQVLEARHIGKVPGS
jgi:hypothetical protein